MPYELYTAGEPVNVLPYDGEVFYFSGILNNAEAGFYFDALLHSIEWKQDEVVLFGKYIKTNRKMAWYSEDLRPYRYSNITREALPFTRELLVLKELSERWCGELFNSCLLNFYKDGNEGMGWHSDDEKAIVANSAIASISLGSFRRFDFRHKENRKTISIFLENGSLLLMKGLTQFNWQHALPKSKKITEPRINLTFRKMVSFFWPLFSLCPYLL